MIPVKCFILTLPPKARFEHIFQLQKVAWDERNRAVSLKYFRALQNHFHRVVLKAIFTRFSTIFTPATFAPAINVRPYPLPQYLLSCQQCLHPNHGINVLYSAVSAYRLLSFKALPQIFVSSFSYDIVWAIPDFTIDTLICHKQGRTTCFLLNQRQQSITIRLI